MTRSFRIRETSLKALDEDAKKLNVSLNTLVNQLLASYTNFDRLFKRFRMIKISNASFRRVLEAASMVSANWQRYGSIPGILRGQVRSTGMSWR